MRGIDKLMEPIDGQPLIVTRWQVLGETGHRGEDRLVVLPPDKPARHAAMQALGANIVINPEPSQGMASSIIAGLRAVPKWCRAALFLPADMPLVTSSDIIALRNAHKASPSSIIRATTPTGQRGNPVLFPRRFFAELMKISGDEGGRAVVNKHATDVQFVTLPGDHATLDLDTPEDWAAWRHNSQP